MRLTSLAVAGAATVALTVVPVAAAWTWPANGPVLRPFAVGADPYAAGQHRGVDIGASAGETVRAPVSGRVSFAGTLPRYGRTVTIRADGLAVTLLYLGELAVTRGTEVTEGQAIALSGPSGDSEHLTPYVHLGVRHADDDNGYVDPLALLPPRTAPAEPAPASSPAVTEPVTAAATPAAPPPEPTLPAAAPIEPAAPVVTGVPAVPAGEPAGMQVVPRDHPAAIAEEVPAASSVVVTHAPAVPVTRPVADRPAPRALVRTRLSASRRAARVVHALPVRTRVAPEARPRAGRPLQRPRPEHVAPAVGPRLGSLVARADAPAAWTTRTPPERHRWARYVLLGLAALAAVAAVAAVPAVAGRRRWKRAVPAARAPCPLGRRGAAARPCSHRLTARGPGCRPSTRPRAGPRVAPRELPYVPA